MLCLMERRRLTFLCRVRAAWGSYRPVRGGVCPPVRVVTMFAVVFVMGPRALVNIKQSWEKKRPILRILRL